MNLKKTNDFLPSTTLRAGYFFLNLLKNGEADILDKILNNQFNLI
jgi:hypothetical protein